MSARGLIVAWISEHDCREDWLLRLYHHLTMNGVPPDAAIMAMELFVDEAVAVKASKAYLTP